MIVIARKLAEAIWHMLTHNQLFNPCSGNAPCVSDRLTVANRLTVACAKCATGASST